MEVRDETAVHCARRRSVYIDLEDVTWKDSCWLTDLSPTDTASTPARGGVPHGPPHRHRSGAGRTFQLLGRKVADDIADPFVVAPPALVALADGRVGVA